MLNHPLPVPIVLKFKYTVDGPSLCTKTLYSCAIIQAHWLKIDTESQARNVAVFTQTILIFLRYSDDATGINMKAVLL